MRQLTTEGDFRKRILSAIQEVQTGLSRLKSEGNQIEDIQELRRHYSMLQMDLKGKMEALASLGDDDPRRRVPSCSAVKQGLESVLSERIRAEEEHRVVLLDLMEERKHRVEAETKAEDNNAKLEAALVEEKRKVDNEAQQAKQAREQMAAQMTLTSSEASRLNGELEKEVEVRVGKEAKMARLMNELETLREAERRFRDMVNRQTGLVQEVQNRLDVRSAEVSRRNGLLDQEKKQKSAALEQTRIDVNDRETEISCLRSGLETAQAELAKSIQNSKVLEAELAQFKRYQPKSRSGTPPDGLSLPKQLHEFGSGTRSTNVIEVPPLEE